MRSCAGSIARTGALEWSTRVDDNPNALIQSDPIVFDGQVLVGVSSHENEEPGADPTDNFTLRGSIVALDAETGAIVWQTFTTSDQTLEHPKFGAGVGVWSSPAIDPRTERLFIGTGNYYEPGSDNPSPPSRHDKDLSDSLVTLSTKNGKVKDHRQFTANDVWGHAFPDGPDFDVGARPTCSAFRAGTVTRCADVVGVGDKEGTYYVMDRDTLEVIWSRKISDGGLIGGIQSTAAVGNGVVYVASHELFDGARIDCGDPPRSGRRVAQFAGGRLHPAESLHDQRARAGRGDRRNDLVARDSRAA